MLAAGSGASTMLALKAAPMLDGDYEALFKTDHMVKDVRFCIEEARRAGVEFPAAEGALQLLTEAPAAGLRLGRFRGDFRGREGRPAAKRAADWPGSQSKTRNWAKTCAICSGFVNLGGFAYV